MNNNSLSRRAALRLLVTGATVALVTGCESLQAHIPRGSPGGTTDGTDLAISVREALKGDPSTAQLQLNITSVGDEVIIGGLVNSQRDVDTVDIVASNVEGVRHVLLEMIVRSQ